MPQISIYLPLYNAEAALEPFLDSLRLQSFEGYELIIIDNGSTDRTPRIASKAAASDGRILFKSFEKRQNICLCNQWGLFLARADLFMITEAKARWSPEYLALLHEAIRSDDNLTLAYGQCGLSYPGPDGRSVFQRVSHDFDLTEKDPKARFIHLLEGPEFPLTYYGLFRRKMLLENHFLRHLFIYDCIRPLQEGLALTGPMVQINKEIWSMSTDTTLTVADCRSRQVEKLCAKKIEPFIPYMICFMLFMASIHTAPLSVDKKDELLGECVRSLLGRWRTELEAEISLIINQVDAGYIQHELFGDESSLPPGAFPYLNRLAYMNNWSSLHYFSNFIPNAPGLKSALSRCLCALGYQEEADFIELNGSVK